MSNKDSTTQILYTGPDVAYALYKNPDIKSKITEWAATLTHATLHINTECEVGEERLHWALTVSSPQGRQSYDIKRSSRGSPVYLAPA